jgi:glycine reductase
VIAKEIERVNIPVAVITAISLLVKQTGASRVVAGVKVPNPCGDPELPPESDRALRKELISCALDALQAEIKEPTLFTPRVVYTRG